MIVTSPLLKSFTEKHKISEWLYWFILCPSGVINFFVISRANLNYSVMAFVLLERPISNCLYLKTVISVNNFIFTIRIKTESDFKGLLRNCDSALGRKKEQSVEYTGILRSKTIIFRFAQTISVLMMLVAFLCRFECRAQ